MRITIEIDETDARAVAQALKQESTFRHHVAATSTSPTERAEGRRAADALWRYAKQIMRALQPMHGESA